MTAPGMVPQPDNSIVDRLAKIEFRIRSMQQNTAGSTTAGGGAQLSNVAGTVLGPVAVPGTLPTAARSDHVHTGLLGALLDVAVPAPATADGLVYSGTQWVNMPPVVTAVASITAPYAGQLVYNSTDAMLYQYTSGAWLAVLALGPDSQIAPTSVQLHEARYRAATTTAQALASGNNAVQFASADYTSNDVSATGTGNTVFTIQRAGLWMVDIGARETDTTAGVIRQMLLTDSTFATVYKSVAMPVSGTGAVELSMTCQVRLSVGTTLSVNFFSTGTGSIDRATAATAARTSFSAAWLRP